MSTTSMLDVLLQGGDRCSGAGRASSEQKQRPALSGSSMITSVPPPPRPPSSAGLLLWGLEVNLQTGVAANHSVCHGSADRKRAAERSF